MEELYGCCDRLAVRQRGGATGFGRWLWWAAGVAGVGAGFCEGVE